MKTERGVLGLAMVAGLLPLACDTTSPSVETEAQAALTLPPINPYNVSAVVNPGCQDTGYFSWKIKWHNNFLLKPVEPL